MNDGNDTVVRIRREQDAYNADFMRRFYAERADEIMSSGNPIRIRLYREHLAREAQRGK